MAGIGFELVGPQAQEVITAPGLLVVSATEAPPDVMKGDSCMDAPVDGTDPPKVELPIIVMIPAVETVPDATYFVGVTAQTVLRSKPVDNELWTASVTDVRHDDAAKITSDTFARTV